MSDKNYSQYSYSSTTTTGGSNEKRTAVFSSTSIKVVNVDNYQDTSVEKTNDNIKPNATPDKQLRKSDKEHSSFLSSFFHKFKSKSAKTSENSESKIRPQNNELHKIENSKFDGRKNSKMSEITQFENECLKEHNRLRATHRSPPLELDPLLCKFAKEWAVKISQQGVLQHRPNNKYGENLYMSYGKAVSGSTAVQAWYSEIKDYNFRNGGFSGSTGHFTQVVWKNSRKLGVAFETKGDQTWVVANYDPPGNVRGQYQENVSA